MGDQLFAFDVDANLRGKFFDDIGGNLYKIDANTGAVLLDHDDPNDFTEKIKDNGKASDGPMINNPVAWNDAIYAGDGGTPKRFEATRAPHRYWPMAWYRVMRGVSACRGLAII